jgi:adenylylsulfate kinase
MQSENIHPIFDKTLQRSNKEELLQQNAKVIWLTGLSGSGKTSIAIGLEKLLHKNGFLCFVLDGDNIRAGINNNLGFSDADRTENIRRIAETAKLFLQAGVIPICCFVSPTKAIRSLAKSVIGEADFLEIFIDTPLQICEQRDVKGLYKKARAGEIKDFTGIHQTFEEPEKPTLKIKTENRTLEESTEQLYRFILPQIKYKHE